MTNLRYEKVNKINIDIAYNVQQKIWPNDPDYDNFLDKIKNPSDNNMSWLVYSENDLIGITGIYTEDIDKDSIWLDWFAILPEYRRSGFGEQVLLDTIKYCKNLNRCSYFRLDTTYYKNRPALFLYDKVMDLKENYTAEDTNNKNNNYLIYTYCLKGKIKPWNNHYLGLNEYYDNCK